MSHFILTTSDYKVHKNAKTEHYYNHYHNRIKDAPATTSICTVWKQVKRY